MSKDTMELAMLAWQLEEASKMLDAQKVPQRGRMVWDGQQMHGGTERPAEVDAYVESLIVDNINARFRGTFRLSRLELALRAAYP
jgi:hypothetical protein